MQNKKENMKKMALVLSICLMLLWGALGTGASLAWFTDTSSEVKNIFHAANFELKVSHKLEDGTYEEIDGQTSIFDDQARYEPGYVQVVYLKVENVGAMEFEYNTAVSVTQYTLATNAFGRRFALQDYLRFGLVTANTEAELSDLVATREQAVAIADKELNQYYNNEYETDKAHLAPGQTAYMAIVVRMPKTVNNMANYRGDDIPRVELGIIVTADQIRN